MKKILWLLLLSFGLAGSSFAQIGWWTSSDTLNVFNKNKGAVLIGSYQPLGKLTVGPDDKFYNLSLVGDYNNLAKNYLQIGVTGRGFENLQGQTIFDLYHSNTQFRNAGYNFRINGQSQFFINGEGNIGIGTEKPEAKLDLTGGPNWGGFNKAIHIPINHAVHFDAGTNQFGLVAQNNELNVVLSNSGTSPFGGSFAKVVTILPRKMVIEGDIEVHGQIISQGQKTAVATNSSVNSSNTANITSNTGAAYNYSTNQVSNIPEILSAHTINASKKQRIKFMTDEIVRMTIADNGNIAIGTEKTSGHRLTVEGVIAARKVIVTQQAWADFVFEPGYQLRTLRQVENHITRYGRLPDVPSAKEIETKGLDVGEVQSTLIQKIEELTLYVIEQNKKIEKLEKENVDIKKRLKKDNKQ